LQDEQDYADALAKPFYANPVVLLILSILSRLFERLPQKELSIPSRRWRRRCRKRGCNASRLRKSNFVREGQSCPDRRHRGLRLVVEVEKGGLIHRPEPMSKHCSADIGNAETLRRALDQ
jgi:hypothetical protein